MSIKNIVDYAAHTPCNMNPAVLEQKVNSEITQATELCQVKSTKLTDYLYQLDYYHWDYDYGNQVMLDFRGPVGACSSVRKGNLYGRNLDWTYGDYVDFVMKMHGYGGRYSSLCVGKVYGINETLASSKKYIPDYQGLPFFAVDGINENYVCCNLNVVPAGDKGETTGTNPSKPSLNMLMGVRVILDYASSARDAIRVLNEYNIYAPIGMHEEIHYMVGDSTSTYIIEFINNKMHILSDQDDEYDDLPNDLAIMTNFYLSGWNGQLKAKYIDPSFTEAEIVATGLTPHAAGLERYALLRDGLDEATDATKMMALMKSVKYTNLYDENMDPLWYSELTGDMPVVGERNYFNVASDFTGLLAAVREQFAQRTRAEGNGTWQTNHTSVYNLSTKTLVICAQEDYEHSYTITFPEA